MKPRKLLSGLAVSLLLVCQPQLALAQAGGTIRGTVRVAADGKVVHNVIITIVQLKRSVQTNEEGVYEITGVAPGSYTVLAHMEGFPDAVEKVTVMAGGTATADIELHLAGLKEEVTVTATGSEQTTFESFQSVTTLDTLRLTEESHPSIGEVLEKEPGVAKRSFGPGSSRPVVRGFDGDRVLITQDGSSTGSLGSQSADHAEPIDVMSLERLEVVKGPATLLYGGSAVGGVVNAVTGHDAAHEGWRGYATGVGATTMDQGGASGGVEYGTGKWMFWGNGSLQRTGDFRTPLGVVEQSFTRAGNGTLGTGWYSDKKFASFTYNYDHRRYGVPFASFFESGGTDLGSDVSINARRHDFKFSGGFRDLGTAVSGFRATLDYSDYKHDEMEAEEVGTTLTNKQFLYRGVFDQKKSGKFSGSFGFAGFHRDYKTVGAEALAPPTIQENFAAFALEEIDLERVRFQLGARLERNSYNPEGSIDRSFTGFSGAAGVRVGLWENGAFVANYTHSYRAPALEELYNNGPHVGNLTFEIGNPLLTRERNDGVDASLRHESKRFHGEANVYYYKIKDFVFLAPTGAINENLIEARYEQADSRFIGAEVSADFGLTDNLFANVGLDAVDAQLTDGTPLPRIPPWRARVGLDFRHKGFSLRPGVLMVKDQDQIFPTETRTPGYAIFDFSGSYTLARTHVAHVFAVNSFNLGNRVYRNHLSFIKDLAPEIGRGVRFTYTVRFF
ncbi:MAG: TonB-dependent receptor [Pyrinomonadaceae bacterium]